MMKLLQLFVQIFFLCGVCYLLNLISEPLDKAGLRLGRFLLLPDEVTSATFQALATSGPEIVMAVLVATAYIDSASQWRLLEFGERACCGTLNMAFSAMDNLLGIGAVAMVYMLYRGFAKKDERFPYSNAVVLGLMEYAGISFFFWLTIRDGIIDVPEAWCLFAMGAIFIFAQILLMRNQKPYTKEDNNEIATKKNQSLSTASALFEYGFLILALVIFVRLAIDATFNIALLSYASVGGVILAMTSYVSSFPEFMLGFYYAKRNRRDELLCMLFGSNIIDLAFAGYRAIHTGESMLVYTTGVMPDLLQYYILALPVVALLLLLGIMTRSLRWKHSYILVVVYVIYILSGLVLL